MKLGLIGAGNMASAILTGVNKSKKFNKNEIFISSRSNERLEEIKRKFGINICDNNIETLKNAKDIVVICVKPQVYDTIVNELKKSISSNQIIVSVMAGKSIEYLQKSLGTKNVVRVMPNTALSVGAGISAVSSDEKVKKHKYYNDVINIFQSVGEVVEVEEKYINAITQVSGSSPAWVFMMIEALADGGVECGLTRDMAYKFATSAVYGAGKMASEKYRENKTIPASLKDMVASPGGTTIEGIRVLEENGFRGAIIDAVMQAYARSIEL